MDTYNFKHFRFKHLRDDAIGLWRLQGPKPGTMAPDFTLMDTSGHPWSLRQQRGRPVLLHFGSYT